MKESKVKLTWNHKYDVLSRSEVLSPVAIESDEDEHEALGVEGSPAEEECEDNCNYNASYEDGHTTYFYRCYQAFWLLSAFPGLDSFLKSIVQITKSHSPKTYFSASHSCSSQDDADLFILSLYSTRPILK